MRALLISMALATFCSGCATMEEGTADNIWLAVMGASEDIADSAFLEPTAMPSQSKPLPVIPPVGAKSCTPKAVIVDGITQWIQVCQ